jgi:hypothetical protein
MSILTNARTQRYAAASLACQLPLAGVASRQGWHLVVADEPADLFGCYPCQLPVGVPV